MSSLAHELRTPLAIVVGYAELLAERDDEETRRDAPAQILHAAERLAAAVDDVLIVLAYETGALTFHPEDVDLDLAVAATVDRLRQVGSTHTVQLERPETWPRVRADGEHLTRIVMNLLVNACKMSPDGCEIRVEADHDDDFVSVTVSDSGFGLTAEQLAVVFERFADLRSPGRPAIAGSGLELYKVRRLVELHGGTVSAESEPDKGSRFTFTVPLAHDEPS